MVKSPGNECLHLGVTGHHGGESAHRMLSVVDMKRRRNGKLKVFGNAIGESWADHGYAAARHSHRFDAAVPGTQSSCGVTERRAMRIRPSPNGAQQAHAKENYAFHRPSVTMQISEIPH